MGTIEDYTAHGCVIGKKSQWQIGWESLATALLLCFAPHPAAEVRFDIWTTASGLPMNSIRAVTQTKDGYLWLSTADGLVRFDGVRFTVFNKGNSPGLPGNRLTALYADANGDLWIGTEGAGLARLHQDQFSSFGPREGLSGRIVHGICGDADGRLWVIADKVLLKRQGHRFVSGLDGGASAVFERGITGVTSQGGIWRVEPDGLHLYWSGKMRSLTLAEGLPSLRVHNVDQDRDGTWWIATDGPYLVEAKARQPPLVYGSTELARLALFDKPSSAEISVLACRDQKANLWLHGMGPWLSRIRNGVRTPYPSTNTLSSEPLPTMNGLPWANVSALLPDAEGNLWIGTDGRGLIRARERPVTVLSVADGLLARNVYPVYEDRAGAVWLGTWDKGLSRFQNGTFTNFQMSSEPKLAKALWQDTDGRLWIGGYGGVTLLQNGKPTTEGVPHGLTNQIVNVIHQDPSGTLWFGAENGLFRYRAGQLTFYGREPGVSRTLVNVIIDARGGGLWIGTHEGLTKLAGDRFTSWSQRDGLPSNHVRSLHEEKDGTLWIGTYDGGLGRFKNGQFVRFTVKEGLFDNGVFRILEDAAGNFWMSSNRGIHRVNKQELTEVAEGRLRAVTAVAFGTSDGLLNLECNGGCWPAGVKTRDGKLWFPTQDGVAVIDPGSLPINTRPPPVLIESFVIDREPYSAHRPLRIEPGQSNLEIHYTALSFINSERLLFKYRLFGFDTDWVQAGTRRTAYYSRLAPGQYSFHVMAANSDGIWNPTGATLAVTVVPAWHQTGGFRLVIAAALCGAAVAFYRRRVARLEKEQALQRSFSRRLMESQDSERKRIAAELHDSLGQELLLIKNRALLGIKTHSPDLPAAEHLQEISRLSSQALQVARDIANNLRPYQLDRFGLTDGIEAIVRKLGGASGIEFTVHVDPIDDLFSAADESHLFRIIQEATNNIVKHSRATRARVEVRREENRLQVLIEDNGCGFSAQPNRSPADLAGGGFGLPGMSERVRFLGGTLVVNTAPDHGTTLQIVLSLTSHG